MFELFIAGRREVNLAGPKVDQVSVSVVASTELVC
jgi:hypothetical protein